MFGEISLKISEFSEWGEKIVSQKDQNWFSEKNKNFECVKYVKSYGIIEKVDLSAEI